MPSTLNPPLPFCNDDPLLSSCDSDAAEEISEDKASELVFCEHPDRASNAAQRVIDIAFSSFLYISYTARLPSYR